MIAKKSPFTGLFLLDDNYQYEHSRYSMSESL
jgi:hypothetical protein